MSEPEIARLARNLAEQNNVDWRRLSGTGPGGLILERDVLDYLARVMAGEEALDPTPEPLPDGMDEWPEVHADSVGNYSRSATAQPSYATPLQPAAEEPALADEPDGLAEPLDDGVDESDEPADESDEPAYQPDDLAELGEDVFLFDDDEEIAPVAAMAAAQPDDLIADDPMADSYAYGTAAATDDPLGVDDGFPAGADDDLLLVSDEPVSAPEEAVGGGWSERPDGDYGSDTFDAPVGSAKADDYLGTTGTGWQEDALSFDTAPIERPEEDLSDLWDTSVADEGGELAAEFGAESILESTVESVAEFAVEPAAEPEEFEPVGFVPTPVPVDDPTEYAAELSAETTGWEAAEVVEDEFVTLKALDTVSEDDAEAVDSSPTFELDEQEPAARPVDAPAFAPAGELGAALRHGELPLVRTPSLLRRNVDVSALAAAQLAAGLELGGDEPLSAVPFLLRAVAKAAQDAGLVTGQVALAEVAGAVRLRRVDDAATRPFVDLVAELAGSGVEEDEVALAVVDLSGLDVDEAVLDLNVPAVTLGRFLYDSDSGDYRSTLALTGALPIAQGARLLARVDELLASPVRLLV